MWTRIWRNIVKKERLTFRGFNKGWAPDKLTSCERDLAINSPGCFHLLFLLSFIRKTKNARLKNPTDLLHKNVMTPLALLIMLGKWNRCQRTWYSNNVFNILPIEKLLMMTLTSSKTRSKFFGSYRKTKHLYIQRRYLCLDHIWVHLCKSC